MIIYLYGLIWKPARIETERDSFVPRFYLKAKIVFQLYLQWSLNVGALSVLDWGRGICSMLQFLSFSATFGPSSTYLQSRGKKWVIFSATKVKAIKSAWQARVQKEQIKVFYNDLRINQADGSLIIKAEVFHKSMCI